MASRSRVGDGRFTFSAARKSILCTAFLADPSASLAGAVGFAAPLSAAFAAAAAAGAAPPLAWFVSGRSTTTEPASKHKVVASDILQVIRDDMGASKSAR